MDSETKDAIYNLELAVSQLASETLEKYMRLKRRLEELERLLPRTSHLNRHMGERDVADNKPQNSSIEKRHEGGCIRSFANGKLAGLKLARDFVNEYFDGDPTNPPRVYIIQHIGKEIAQLEKELK